MTTYCTSCGAALDPGTRFCAQCGTAHSTGVPGVPADPAPTTGRDVTGRVMPPAAPTGTGAPVPLTMPDWRKLLVGNWLGAAVVAAATAATAGVLGLALALLAKPTDFGLDNTLTMATVIATAAFGADARLEASASGGGFGGDAVGYVGFMPLLVLLIAGAVGVWLFRRVTAGYPSGLLALGDAARTALLFGLFLLVPALVFTSDNDKMGRGWGRELSANSLGLEGTIGANPAGAFFLGFLVLFVILATAVLVRGDWFAGRWAAVHQWVAGPVRATATLLVLSPVAGGIAYAAVLLTGDETDTADTGWRAVVAALIAVVPNVGLWTLSLGTGAPFGTTTSATDESTTRDYERLWGSITEDEPGLWVAPAVALLLLVVVAWGVLRAADPARRAGDLRQTGTGSGWTQADGSPTPLAALGVWVASLVVVVPVLMWISRGSGSISGSYGHGKNAETYEAVGVGGPDLVQTTLLVVLVAALVAFALAMATGALHPQTVRSGLARVGASVQSAPGTTPASTQAGPGTSSAQPPGGTATDTMTDDWRRNAESE